MSDRLARKGGVQKKRDIAAINPNIIANIAAAGALIDRIAVTSAMTPVSKVIL